MSKEREQVKESKAVETPKAQPKTAPQVYRCERCTGLLEGRPGLSQVKLCKECLAKFKGIGNPNANPNSR